MATKKATKKSSAKKPPAPKSGSKAAKQSKKSKGGTPAPVADGLVRCGSLKTHNGKPCGIIALPCRHHDPSREGQPKVRSQTARTRRMIVAEKLAQGATQAEAGRAAGYSESTLNGDISRIAREPEVIEMVRERIREAHGLDTNEIVGKLVSQMRADLYYIDPTNPILRDAHERGVSHWLKKTKERKRLIPQGTGKEPIAEITTEIEIASPLEATKQLASILGMQHLQAPNEKAAQTFESMVDRVFANAKASGFDVTREDVEDEVRPLFAALDSKGVITSDTNVVS